MIFEIWQLVIGPLASQSRRLCRDLLNLKQKMKTQTTSTCTSALLANRKLRLPGIVLERMALRVFVLTREHR